MDEVNSGRTFARNGEGTKQLRIKTIKSGKAVVLTKMVQQFFLHNLKIKQV